MSENLTMVICIVVCAALILFTGKQTMDYRKQLAQYKEASRNCKKISFLKTPIILVTIMTLVALYVVFYGLTIDFEYFWIGLLLVVMCITEFVMLSSRYTLYYNDNDFLGDKGKVLYRNIKSYEFSKVLPRLGSVKIHLFTGDTIIVSQKAYRFIHNQAELMKERKKEMKENRKKHAA